MTATLQVHFHPNPVNGWFLRLFSTPWSSIDGDERPCSWRAGTSIAASAGDHELVTFIRYRRAGRPLGAGRLAVHLPEGSATTVEARNGPVNSDPFIPKITSQSLAER